MKAMEDTGTIRPPTDGGDREGAQRVFEEFLTLYQPTFILVEYHLEDVIESAGPAYAQAYKPWYDALHTLFKGVYLTAKKIPLPDTEKFIDALHTFSFEGTLQFLSDLCISCKLKVTQEWLNRFREHIKLLLFSLSILHNKQAYELTR